MPLIDYVRAEDATGRAKEILERGNYDKRSLMMEAVAVHPPLAEAVREGGRRTLFEGDLDTKTKELIGVVVSQVNGCSYCTASHRENLFKLRVPGEQVLAIADRDYDALPNPERTVASFADLVAHDANAVTPDHLDDLHDLGFTDANVVEMIGVVGHFNAVNTYASALGVDPADRDDDLPRYLELDPDEIDQLETLWRTER